MKDAIVNILEGVLILFVIAVTIAGFMVAGEGGPFGDFNIGRALLGGLGGLLVAALSSSLSERHQNLGFMHVLGVKISHFLPF